jgi:WD40 repeat protein
MKSEGDPGSSSSGARRGPDRTPPAIPNFTMLRRIGGGSYGEVWLARDVLGNYRAVKVVYRNQFFDERPFQREFEGIRRFEPVSRSHPSQVSLFHVGRNEAEGYFYYVLELADDQHTGQQIDPDRYEPKTLRSELKQRGRMQVKECIEIGLALTTALKHLHAANLIHRDVKPSNVIFVHGLPKLADIGLVAAAGDECSVVGTEGKVLYEMLTGLSPKSYPSLPDDWVGSDRQAPELNAVVVKACAANPAERYRSAEEMAADLEFVKGGKSLLFLQRLQRAYRRVLMAFIVMVLGGFVVGFFVFRQRAQDQFVRSELRQIHINRTKNPHAGWFATGWSNLTRIAAVRADREVLEQVSATLAGLDAKLMKEHTGVAGGSGAFGPDGRAIIGGLGTGGAMLMDTNGDLTLLPVTGEGPVCWPDNDTPLQLSVVSNHLVLREAMTGVVRRQFMELSTQQSRDASAPLLALSPDGRNAAAAVNGKVLVWWAATGKLPREVVAKATALAFSPDGSRLGVGEADGTTRVFFVSNLTNEVVIRGPRENPVHALAFVRDPLIPYRGNRDSNSWLLATADQSTEIVIWDLQNQQPSIACRGSIWQITALAFHPEGMILGSAGQAVGRLWDARRGLPLLNFGTGTGPVRFVAFDREGRRMIWGAEPGTAGPVVGLRELEFGRGITPLRGLRSAARKVWFSPDGRRLAAVSDDWHLGVWAMVTNKLVALLEAPVGDVADNAGGAFDVTGERFAFASWKEACVFDLRTGQTIHRWPLDKGYSDQVIFDADERLLLLRREMSAEHSRWIWRLRELANSGPVLLHQQTNSNWSPGGMTFLVDGKHFLVWHGGNPEGFLRAYDIATGREIWKVATGRNDGDLRICLDPGGRRFAHDSKSGQPLRLFRLPDFQPVGLAATGCNAIGPSGEQFLLPPWFLSGRSGDDGFPLRTDWTELGFVSAFSLDGSLLAWGTEEGEVLLAHLDTVRRRLASLKK